MLANDTADLQSLSGHQGISARKSTEGQILIKNWGFIDSLPTDTKPKQSNSQWEELPSCPMPILEHISWSEIKILVQGQYFEKVVSSTITDRNEKYRASIFPNVF